MRSLWTTVSLFWFGCSLPLNAQETVTDIDGNVYQTAVIGDQVWMLENLKTTTLKDGEPITEFKFSPGNGDWFFDGIDEPLYVLQSSSDLNDFYDFELPRDFYGLLYSQGAITSGQLAPEGWRVASEQDFMELESFVSSDGNAGNTSRALRRAGDWPNFIEPGIDIYGFRALPAGSTTVLGTADFAQSIALWGTTDTGILDGEPTTKMIQIFKNATLEFVEIDARFGPSIRCVKDFRLGDINNDGLINLLDVSPFVDLLTANQFKFAADINQDGFVSLLDVRPLVDLLDD